MHFEVLWEKCEKLHKEAGDNSSASLAQELSLKLDLYKILDSKSDLSNEDKQKIKSRLLGEILLTITNISLVDNINVYQALDEALKFRTIEHLSSKY
jgi:hypothetical protein